MNVTITEHEGCFSIEVKAETMGEAALFTRMGVNATKGVRSVTAFVGQTTKNGETGGDFSLSVVLGKSRRSNNYLPRRK